MSTAHEIRRRVEQGGGRLEMSVRELRDAHGVARLTAAGRRTISDDLRREGILIDPPLDQSPLDSRIALVDVNRRAVPPARAARADRPAGAPVPRSASSKRTRGILAGAAASILVLLIAVALGSGDGDAPVAPPAEVTKLPAASDRGAAAVAGQTRGEALARLSSARSALEADDPDTARRLLAEIDPRYRSEPALGRRIVRAGVLVRLTERYVRAEDLADAGSYEAARNAMLALGPFRRSAEKAAGYGTLAARSLVSQARGVYVSRPRRALAILDRAGRLAPGLAAVETARTLASGRLEALSAPPAPEPVASPACDPEYAGACIPVVSYDLNCGDVAAEDFRSVGSDPHGFDREGDGLACES